MGAGAEPRRDHEAGLDDTLGLGHQERLRVRVHDHELDPLEAALDHVVDRIPAGATDAENGDPGLQFPDVRGFEIDRHRLGLILWGVPSERRFQSLFTLRTSSPAAGETSSSLETLLDPSPDPGEVAVAAGGEHAAFPSRLEMLDIGDLRIDEEADGGREGRAFGGLGQTLDAERPADAYLFREGFWLAVSASPVSGSPRP